MKEQEFPTKYIFWGIFVSINGEIPKRAWYLCGLKMTTDFFGLRVSN